MKCVRSACVGMGLLLSAGLAWGSEAKPVSVPAVTLDIKSQPIADALNQWAQATGFQLIFPEEAATAALVSPELRGRYEPKAALAQLLVNTGLKYEFVSERTVRITSAGASKKAAAESASHDHISLARADDTQGTADSPASDRKASVTADSKGVPEVLVQGSRILNMDIQRSEDDAQPYVIFDGETIRNSGATTLEDFLKTRLTMNTTARTNSQIPGFGYGSTSSINLRGLGTNQTLILVDGRRLPNLNVPNYGSGEVQPDINGIPIEAVERIDILPTTASGIYGGSATGGVVNIILKHDYRGMSAKAGYDNTFDVDSQVRTLDLSAGFGLNGGKTSVLAAFSYKDSNSLQVQDRPQLYKRGLANLRQNYPQFFTSSVFRVPYGATANIVGVTAGNQFANLSLKGGASLGSPFTHAPIDYAGAAADGTMALLQNAGQFNYDLTRDTGNTSLVDNPTSRSSTFTVRHEFNERFSAFLDASNADTTSYLLSSDLNYTVRLPSSSPYNPFDQEILVRASIPGEELEGIYKNNDLRMVGGFIARLGGGWSAELDLSWARHKYTGNGLPYYDSSVIAADVASGALDIDPLRDSSLNTIVLANYDISPPIVDGDFRSTLRNATVRVAGPVGRIAGGPLTLSTLLERREENYNSTRSTYDSPGFSYEVVYPAKAQSVDSVYAELSIPLFSSLNGRRGLRELELQVAGRWDSYETDGANGAYYIFDGVPTTEVIRARSRFDSVNPTVGLRFKPVNDLMLRASFGTGFLPPSVFQVTPDAPQPPYDQSGSGVVDPRRNNEPLGIMTYSTGGNPGLKPEESRSWSAGAVLTPDALSGLRVSLDYARIHKTDNIRGLSLQEVLEYESSFPERVVRAPLEPGDTNTVGRVISADLTLVNLARTSVEAYDLAVDYQFEASRFGTFGLYAAATWQTHYQTQIAPDTPLTEGVGLASSNPLKFKGNAGLTWMLRALTLGWNARYFDSYFVADPNNLISQEAIVAQGNGGRIPSQVYHDVFGIYRLPESMPLIGNTEIRGGVRNVFNTRPPYEASFGVSTVYYSMYGDARLASYYLSVKKNF